MFFVLLTQSLIVHRRLKFYPKYLCNAKLDVNAGLVFVQGGNLKENPKSLPEMLKRLLRVRISFSSPSTPLMHIFATKQAKLTLLHRLMS